jgi:coenzyme Q-binding protein COQ10
MAATEQSVRVNVPPEAFYKVIADYESYPDILPEMEFAQILERTNNTVTARFTINLIKRVSYTLKLVEDDPQGLSWSLVEGPFKKNSGGWRLERTDDGGTLAHYSVEVNVGLFVPKSVSNRLVGKTLPALLAHFKKRAESLA